jgi:hypothetical protein
VVRDRAHRVVFDGWLRLSSAAPDRHRHVRGRATRGPESAPASLRDIEATRLVIEDGTAVLHYTRGAEVGTATFTFGSMY